MLAICGFDAAAQTMCGCGLTRTRNVIQLAFHRQHGRGADVLRAHQFVFTLKVFNVPSAVHQTVVLENCLDGFQIVISVHVEHSVVLVIELAVRFGAGVIAFDQVFEVIVMACGMAIGVHGHEAGVLQETRIDATSCAWKVAGHFVNHIVFEPLETLVGGQVVHGGGRLARIDRATHHGHGQGCGFAARCHE